MKVRFLKIAQQELDSAVNYYNNERSGLGYEFLLEVFAAIDRIKGFPEAAKMILKEKGELPFSLQPRCLEG